VNVHSALDILPVPSNFIIPKGTSVCKVIAVFHPLLSKICVCVIENESENLVYLVE
jgi:hypothetical protein